MTKLIKNDIEDFIKERIDAFRIESVVVPCYIDETNVIKDYEGRQILELIQNADDAEAKNVSITLDRNEKELVFFNDGKAFDLEGIQSIMVAHNSSKVTSSYIGNKGLGFRSILSWAKSVTIYSAGLKIEFSNDVIKWYLDNKLQSLKSNLPAIRVKKKLSEECIPIPVLGLPLVSEEMFDGCTKDNGCALKIVYNEDEEQHIIDQINNIDDRTLLFLPHINSVQINIDKQTSYITIDNGAWDISDKNKKEGDLPGQYQDKNKSEKKKYFIQIAIPESRSLDKPSPLYNYLPSKEMVYLPFLLHATVELDSSRNHVNNNIPVNGFILEKAAELIYEIAKEHLEKTQNRPDWIAYRMMTPTVSEKEYGNLINLYCKLDELKKDMKIYPTVGNQYVTEQEYCYYNDAVSAFWDGFEVKSGPVSKMLKPIASGYEIESKHLWDFVDAINEVSKSIGDIINNRVSLIRHIYDHKNVLLIDQSKLQVLIDNDGNVIEGDAYVQDSGDKELAQNRPQWVTYDIVDSDLAKALIEKFHNEIQSAKQLKRQEGQESYSDVRCLVGLLDFANIHYFDITRAATMVVSQANERLDADVSGKPTLICEMLDYIYDLKSEAKLERVRLLDANGNVCKAEDLLLPTSINKQIFGDDAQYVLDFAGWRTMGFLSRVQEDQFDGFMEKMGANRILGEKKFRDCISLGYYKYLEARHIGYNQQELLKGSGEMMIPVIRESIMEKLKQVSLQEVLLFVSSYNEVFEHLREPIKLEAYFSARNRKPRPTQFNFVRYQLSTLPNVKWKVFGTNLILDDTVFVGKQTPEVKRKTDDAVELIRTDFQYEAVNEIQRFLIEDYSKKHRDGKNAQILYKLIVDGWGERETGMENVELYASDAYGKKDFHPSEKVFYTSNTCLPKEVVKKLGLFRLDYATRQAANNITSIFGLFKIDELNFQIEEPIASDFCKEFDIFFRELRPYFLLYAIQNASKDSSKATIAGYIKKCNIHLVSKCVYSIKGEEPVDLGEGEFINVENDYYLKVPVGFSLAEMKSSPTYCDAVMEILGMAFKLETKNEHFLHVFQSFDFMKRYIDETRKDDIVECYKLLGISLDETNFWRKYGELKGLELSFDATDFYDINGPKIEFGRDDVKNVDFSSWNNKKSIEFLNEVLNRLGTDDKKVELLETVDLSAWHKIRFEHVKTRYRTAFAHRLWTILNGKGSEKERLLLNLQFEYENISLEEDWRHEMKKDADFLLYLNQRVREMFEQNDLDSGDVCLEDDVKAEGPKNRYHHLVKNEQDEKDMGDERWMLYFDGYDDAIRDNIERQRKKEQEDSEDYTQDDTAVIGEIVTVGVVEPPLSNIPGKGKGGKGGGHTTETERRKAKWGAFAERQVDKYLRQMVAEDDRYEYGDEDWVSKKNDTLGYDFTYIFNDQTRYLEAKYLADHTFILTANEYKVAMDNKEIYDIATVDKNGKVTIHPAFFKGAPKFDVKDYFVSFVIPQ